MQHALRVRDRLALESRQDMTGNQVRHSCEVFLQQRQQTMIGRRRNQVIPILHLDHMTRFKLAPAHTQQHLFFSREHGSKALHVLYFSEISATKSMALSSSPNRRGNSFTNSAAIISSEFAPFICASTNRMICPSSFAAAT